MQIRSTKAKERRIVKHGCPSRGAELHIFGVESASRANACAIKRILLQVTGGETLPRSEGKRSEKAVQNLNKAQNKPNPPAAATRQPAAATRPGQKKGRAACGGAFGRLTS